MEERLARLLVRRLRGKHPADEMRRWESLIALGDAAVPALVPSLADASVDTRRWAAVLLMRIDTERARELLATAHGDPDRGVRSYVGTAMARRRDPRALGLLTELVQNGLPYMVTRALEDLAALGDARAIPLLVDELEHGDRYRASVALSKLGPPGLDALARIGRSAADAEVRASAAHALGLGRDSRFVPLLAEWSRDASERVRSSAATALGAIGGAEAAAALEPLLDDPADLVRVWALRAWAPLAPARLVARLPAALADASSSVQLVAAEAAGAAGDPAAEPLLLPLLAQSDDVYLLCALAEALGRIGGDASARALAALRVRRGASSQRARRRLRHEVAFALASIDRRMRSCVEPQSQPGSE